MSVRGRGAASSRGRGGATRGGRASPVDLSEVQATSDAIEQVESVDGQDDSTEQTSSRGGRGGRGGKGRGGVVRKQRQFKPLKVVPEPDKAAHDAALAAHTTKLADINKRIESFTSKIETLAKSRKAIRTSVKSLADNLVNIRQTSQSHFAEYDRLKAEIEAFDNQSINHKKELESLKKSLGTYQSLVDLDNAIKQKEKLLNSRTLQLAQEREALDEVKRLRIIRPKLIEFDKKSKEVVAKVDTTELAAQRDAAFNAGHACKDSETKAVAALAAETKKEEQIVSELDDLVAQRRTLINERQNHERTWLAVLDEFNAQMKVYEVYKKEKDWRDGEEARRAQNQKEFEERQARWEFKQQQKREWEEQKRYWQEEQARIEAEKDPFEEEKQCIEDLTRYLSALAVKFNITIEDGADDSADNSRGSESAAQLAAERAAAFGGKSVKPLEKTNKKDSVSVEGKKQAEKKSTKPKQAKPLSHVTDVFRLFSRISVSPPALVSDIPTAYKAVLAKQEYYDNAPRPEAQSTKSVEEVAGDDADEEEEVQITTAVSDQ